MSFENLGIFARSMVRPVVTFGLVGGGIAASFMTGNYEWLFSSASVVTGFWFADRAKEREAQQMVYGHANEDHVWMQHEMMKEMNGMPSDPADGKTKQTEVKEAIGYQLPYMEV